MNDAQMTHIAIVKNSGWHMARHSGEQIRYLVERGWRVTAIADYALGGLDEVLALKANAINVPFESARINAAKNLTCLIQVSTIFRQIRPDVVHCIGLNKAMIHGGLAAKITGMPAVAHTVAGKGVLGNPGHSSVLRKLLGFLGWCVLGRHQPVIFQNREDMADLIASGFVDAKDAHYIPGCGVDIGSFGDPPQRPAPTHFVMASRMLWSKGVLEFVEAARIVQAQRPDTQFSIFGGCSDDYGSANPDFISRGWLEELNREGIVRWHARVKPEVVEQVLRSKSTAAAVLLSSYGEGVPRFLIEAAACGLPIITTNRPGCRDVVEDGRSGWLCEPSTGITQSAALGMLHMLDQPTITQAWGARSRELAMRFDVSRIMENTLRVYEIALTSLNGDFQCKSA